MIASLDQITCLQDKGAAAVALTLESGRHDERLCMMGVCVDWVNGMSVETVALRARAWILRLRARV